MKLKIAVAISVVSIGLLLIYGIDVIIQADQEQGFLPLDSSTRGIVLGIPATVLPIIAFFTTRKIRSRTLGFLILACGVLIVGGSAEFLISQDLTGIDESQVQMARLQSFGPVIIMGGFVSLLGIYKIAKW